MSLSIITTWLIYHFLNLRVISVKMLFQGSLMINRLIIAHFTVAYNAGVTCQQISVIILVNYSLFYTE